MSHPNTTANAQAMADRQFTVHDKIRELMKDNPGKGYAWAFEEAKKLPELKDVFDAMKLPAALDVAGRNPEQVKASAQFQAKVKTAVHQRGITWDQAWNDLRIEEPALFRAMAGNHDPSQQPEKQDPWRA